MSYVWGFAAAVPQDRKADYLAHARQAWEHMFKGLGALSAAECWEDAVPEGEVTSFPKAVKRQAGEAVVFGWIEWPDKATHDAAMARMSDPAFDPGFDMSAMPFDGRRMIFGGFEVLMRARA
ncbi:MAG: DUF1428 domain-containing protein [Hasllibacter sp.]